MAALTEDDTGISRDPAIGWLSEKAKQFSDDADELRATTDRAAKGLGALAVAGLTGVGIAKVGGIHPMPDSYWPLLFLWLGFLLMVFAILAFVYRFWLANRPLALSARIAEMSPEQPTGLVRKLLQRDSKYEPQDRRGDASDRPERNQDRRGDASDRPERKQDRRGDASDRERKHWVTDLNANECRDVASIYDHAMRHAPFAAPNEFLADYESRADRLEHDALYTPDSPASRRRLEQVERMRAEIEKAQERAKVVVVRRRMNHVFSKPIAVFLALLFVLGLGMFASAADYFDRVESQNTGAASR